MSDVKEKSEQMTDSGRAWLPRSEVVRAINPHLLNLLKIESQHEVHRARATELLSPARLDVMAKYVYAFSRLMKSQTAWGAHVYREHLRVWNEFRESDRSGKSSYDGYRESFDSLLEAFGRAGFDESRGLLPVGHDDVIIDGSHRLAAAIAFDCPVTVVRFGIHAARYDYQYFRERGLSADVLDDMALQYCRLDRRVRVAVLFPVARGHDEAILDLLQERGAIVYRKAVAVTRSGRANLIRLLYRGEAWLGDGIRPTAGLLHHVNNRFVDYEPVRFVFFMGESGEANREAKDRIRALFDLGNDSVHINDMHRQTVSIAESVLNANSVHFLNHAKAATPRNFARLFEEYKDWIATGRIDGRRMCVDGSAVLAAYGLRDANDLDYLYAGDPTPCAPNPLISCHNAELPHYGIPVDDLVMDPRNHFWWEGMKFLALHRIREMKVRRAEPKDASDVYRIDALEGKVGVTGRMLSWYYTLPERLYSLRYKALRAAKRMIPAPLLPAARAVYRLPQLVRTLIGPHEQVTIYRGFELHYSRGTSLIEVIRNGRIYEPDVSRQLAQALGSTKSPLWLDIGANIGLMTLNVLAEVPEARVVAFEPGPHQAELLERNVTANRLSGRVTVQRCALSHHVGMAQFAVHRTRHASGDGFFDTHRAGRTRTTEVPVTTLDHWWWTAGQPRVDAVKIDTEGAELWVLEGGQSMLASCRPLIIFELHPENIRVYPYQAIDVLRFFHRRGYRVRTLAGTEITEDNLGRHLESANDYLARFEHG